MKEVVEKSKGVKEVKEVKEVKTPSLTLPLVKGGGESGRKRARVWMYHF